MKILRTRNGNALMACNVVSISKQRDYSSVDKISSSITAYDVRGHGHCLCEDAADGEVDQKFQRILDYLTSKED